MTEQDKGTVTELAQVIAELSEDNRELRRLLDEQSDVIVDFELDQENSEKVDAALFQDLKTTLEFRTLKGARERLQELLGVYFGDFE